MVTPTVFPWDKKSGGQKKVEQTNVLIPWYPINYLTIASSVFFGRLRVPTQHCDLVVPAEGGWGHSNKNVLSARHVSRLRFVFS